MHNQSHRVTANKLINEFKNSPMAVDFFTQVGTPFSVLQYSFSPQTVLAQLASVNEIRETFVEFTLIPVNENWICVSADKLDYSLIIHH